MTPPEEVPSPQVMTASRSLTRVMLLREATEASTPEKVWPAVMVYGLRRLTRPIWLPLYSVNQRLPSESTVMPPGTLLLVGMTNSVMVPVGVIRPMLLPAALYSVNQRLPSGPRVISLGPLPLVGTGNSVMLPAGVMR